MDAKIAEALKTDRTIDITTTGRKSGEKRRWEIWFHNIENELYITGTPGRRDWYANLVANPDMIFHLKETTQADIPARATAITDTDAKRPVMEKILANLGHPEEIDERVEKSPLLHIKLQLD